MLQLLSFYCCTFVVHVAAALLLFMLSLLHLPLVAIHVLFISPNWIYQLLLLSHLPPVLLPHLSSSSFTITTIVFIYCCVNTRALLRLLLLFYFVVFNFCFIISLLLWLYSSTTTFIYWCLHLIQLLRLYLSIIVDGIFIYYWYLLHLLLLLLRFQVLSKPLILLSMRISQNLFFYWLLWGSAKSFSFYWVWEFSKRFSFAQFGNI